jgi:hypothetical protein
LSRRPAPAVVAAAAMGRARQQASGRQPRVPPWSQSSVMQHPPPSRRRGHVAPPKPGHSRSPRVVNEAGASAGAKTRPGLPGVLRRAPGGGTFKLASVRERRLARSAPMDGPGPVGPGGKGTKDHGPRAPPGRSSTWGPARWQIHAPASLERRPLAGPSPWTCQVAVGQGTVTVASVRQWNLHGGIDLRFHASFSLNHPRSPIHESLTRDSQAALPDGCQPSWATPPHTVR